MPDEIIGVDEVLIGSDDGLLPTSPPSNYKRMADEAPEFTRVVSGGFRPSVIRESSSELLIEDRVTAIRRASTRKSILEEQMQNAGFSERATRGSQRPSVKSKSCGRDLKAKRSRSPRGKGKSLRTFLHVKSSDDGYSAAVKRAEAVRSSQLSQDSSRDSRCSSHNTSAGSPSPKPPFMSRKIRGLSSLLNRKPKEDPPQRAALPHEEESTEHPALAARRILENSLPVITAEKRSSSVDSNGSTPTRTRKLSSVGVPVESRGQISQVAGLHGIAVQVSDVWWAR